MIETLINRYDLLNKEIEQRIIADSVEEIEFSARKADQTLDEIIQYSCGSGIEAEAKFKFLIDLMKLEYFESRKGAIAEVLTGMFLNQKY